MENREIRKGAVDSARQIIVKAGTRLLTSRESIAELVSGIAQLRRAGKQVLLMNNIRISRLMSRSPWDISK